MRNTLPLLFLLLSFGACKYDINTTTADEEQPTQTNKQASAPITSEDAQLYQRLLAEREDVYPLDCNFEVGKVNPADEAPRDTAFFLFRESLKEIVANKDIFALLPHVSEDIKASFGEDNGLQGFIRMWELDSPEKVPLSNLWSELGAVLALGGQFEDYGNDRGKYFVAPYLEPCWPATVEPYEYGVVIGAGVRLRSSPGLSTKIIKTLSHDLVKYIETTPTYETIGGESHPWIKVALADGTEGFLYGKFYRSPLDVRAGFQQDETGSWKLVTLVAGD